MRPHLIFLEIIKTGIGFNCFDCGTPFFQVKCHRDWMFRCHIQNPGDIYG